MPGRSRGALWGVALLVGAVPASAQQPPVVPPPPIVADTSDLTARFLEAGDLQRQLMTPISRPGTDGLLPIGARLVFNRDSIEWSHAGTVGELLQEVPGLYLLRGHWLGTPEVPLYQGRMGTVVEYLVDGVPFLPGGDDSTAVDPSTLPLSFYDEVAIERHPGGLRVILLTRRHDRAAPRSRVVIGTGDLEASRYQGSLEKRFANGAGFSGAFDFLSVGGLRDRRVNDYQNTTAWLQASLVRTTRSGIVAQYFLSNPIRRVGFGPSSNTTDTLSRPLEESRRDLQLRGYVRQRSDGLGGSVDVIFSRSTWQFKDSVVVRDSLAPRSADRNQVGVIAGYRTPVASTSLSAWRRTGWTNLDALGKVGLSPDRRLALAAEAGYRRHSEGRTSEWVMVSASAVLPLGASATGAWKWGTIVERPMLSADSGRTANDWSVMLGWASAPLAAEVGYVRTSAPSPAESWSFPMIGLVGRETPAEWITARLRLTPVNWFTVDGWHSMARDAASVDGQPPTHTLVTAAIRSKFQRVYPSGFFELKAAATLESFGSGVLARMPAGQPIALPGATFLRAQVQLHFGEFIAYWDRQNILSTPAARTPGIPSLAAANVFGIRWVFWN